MPEVSIVINCLNGERYLRETLDSVYSQTFDDWEIVFWDNASTDRSGEIATGYGDKVRYFRAETTTPLGPARSLAYQQTLGKYVAILDADDIWLPQKLERQVELFKSNDELGLVYCDSFMFDGGGDRFRLFQAGTPQRGYVFGQLMASNFIFTSTMMYNRRILDQLDYVFDERFARAQDYELSLRVAYNSPIDYVNEPLCRWRMYQDNAEWRNWKKSLIPRVVELKIAIDNLLEIYPDIETEYGEELRKFYKGLDYNYGVTAWEKGDRSEARRNLSKHLSNKKFAFVYFCTFFMPYPIFERVKAIYRNGITGRVSSKNS